MYFFVSEKFFRGSLLCLTKLMPTGVSSLGLYRTRLSYAQLIDLAKKGLISFKAAQSIYNSYKTAVMPYFKRPARKRRTYKRRSYKKKSASKDFVSTTLAYYYSIVASAGGIIDDYVSLRSPTNVVDGAGVSDDWTAFIGLYDQYRVRRVHWTYVPSQSEGDTSQVNQMLSIGVDQDAAVAATSHVRLQSRSQSVVRNLANTIKFNAFVKNLNSGAGGFSIGQGWMDTANPPQAGCIQLYADGLNASHAYGKVIVKYDIEFKLR